MDLVTFTEEIFNGKLYFMCSDISLTLARNWLCTFLHGEQFDSAFEFLNVSNDNKTR